MSHTRALKTLTYAGAVTVTEAAASESLRIGVPVCIAVCDVSGHPILTARLDGAPFAGNGIAIDKARTVVGFNGFATGEWWASIKDDPALVHGITHTPGLTIFGGGLGLFEDAVLVGAIGVSGGSTAEDESVAEAGAYAIGAR